MMKKAKVIPLFKKKDKHDMQNYRPISILSVFSKPLEKLMHNRLLLFLKKTSLPIQPPTWIHRNQIHRNCKPLIHTKCPGSSGQAPICNRYFP